MITHLTYGTYIFFGLLTFGGAAFIFFFFPETKGLSLEEMDIIFGSAGLAAADAERMREINEEVGLDDIVHGSVSGQGGQEPVFLDEKNGAEHKDHDVESE
jgi:hypothetical protein